MLSIAENLSFFNSPVSYFSYFLIEKEKIKKYLQIIDILIYFFYNLFLIEMCVSCQKIFIKRRNVMLKKFSKTLLILLLITVFVLPAFAQRVEKERAEFKKLITQNPNYFGTLSKFKLKPVKKIWYNKKYEEVKCLGFYPERSLLKAIIHVKLPYGYGGDLCKRGTFEYVRFYADWNGDGDYKDEGEDLGLASVNVHDIPNIEYPCVMQPKPLSYSLSLLINPKKYSCPTPYLVKVKAILSWFSPPTPGNPNYIPVWGNSVERWIQIKPKTLFLLQSIGKKVDYKKLKIKPPELEKMPPPKLKIMKPEELKMAYQVHKVPELRYNFKNIYNVAMTVKKTPNLKAKYSADPKTGNLLKYSKFVYLPKPNISYEQLTCVGLNYDREMLEATLSIKKSYGYSGELCKKQGSYEYVAFWLYVKGPLTRRCSWRYVGTARVNVHDIKPLPPDGLRYAVYQPVDFSGLRGKCTKPVVLRVRAIMSWNIKPPTNNPDYKPVWGNTLETAIQIKPGKPVNPGQQRPYITHVGMMPVEGISGNPYTMFPSTIGDGYANGVSLDEGFTAIESPFGGLVTICGTISYPPNNPAEADKLRYRVQYRKDGESYWHNITRNFRIWINIDSVPSGYIDQVADAEGYFKFQKDLTPPKIVEVRNDTLAVWPTPSEDGLYEIRASLKKGGIDISTDIIKVMVDNTPPDPVSISLNAGACTIFKIPTVITGKFKAYDKHFWKYSISLLPYAPPAGPPTDPFKYFYHEPVTGLKYTYGTNGVYGTTLKYGTTNGKFRLNTATLMKQCGYVFYLYVWDRAIINNDMDGNRGSASVGFCLID